MPTTETPYGIMSSTNVWIAPTLAAEHALIVSTMAVTAFVSFQVGENHATAIGKTVRVMTQPSMWR